MYPLRITHPEHGAMHVYNEGELAAHRALGWAPEVPKPAVVAPVAEVPESAPTVSEPADDPEDFGYAPVKRGPGRPRKQP